MAKDPGFPYQPTYIDKNGTRRFQANAIVRFLLDAGPFDMNKLAVLPNIPDADRAQFAQLIGYSVGGWEDLGYTEAFPSPDETANGSR